MTFFDGALFKTHDLRVVSLLHVQVMLFFFVGTMFD